MRDAAQLHRHTKDVGAMPGNEFKEMSINSVTFNSQPEFINAKDIVNEFLKVDPPLDVTILVDENVTQFDDKAEILNKFNIYGCKAYQALHSCLKNSKSAEETVQKIAEAFGVDTSEYNEPSKKKKKSE